MGINLASYVGATQVRRVVLGDVNRAPTAEELEQMKTLVREAMQQGAVGRLNRAAICACALCENRRTDRPCRRGR